MTTPTPPPTPAPADLDRAINAVRREFDDEQWHCFGEAPHRESGGYGPCLACCAMVVINSRATLLAALAAAQAERDEAKREAERMSVDALTILNRATAAEAQRDEAQENANDNFDANEKQWQEAHRLAHARDAAELRAEKAEAALRDVIPMLEAFADFYTSMFMHPNTDPKLRGRVEMVNLIDEATKGARAALRNEGDGNA